MAGRPGRNSSQSGRFQPIGPKGNQAGEMTTGRPGSPLPAQVNPPAMREVRKGWWTSTERRVTAGEFEKVDRKGG
jgi:hypothetical protein